LANIDKAIKWFREKYNIREYFFVFREYKTQSVIKNDLRYKVENIYPHKDADGFYFIVCKKSPVKKEKKYSDDFLGDIFAEHKVYL
jgi:hypothetical protein